MVGKGTIQWNFRDDFGDNQIVQVEGYLVPISIVTLFSLQFYFKINRKGSFSINVDGSIFSFGNRATLLFGYYNQRLILSIAIATKPKKNMDGVF